MILLNTIRDNDNITHYDNDIKHYNNDNIKHNSR